MPFRAAKDDRIEPLGFKVFFDLVGEPLVMRQCVSVLVDRAVIRFESHFKSLLTKGVVDCFRLEGEVLRFKKSQLLPHSTVTGRAYRIVIVPLDQLGQGLDIARGTLEIAIHRGLQLVCE